MMNKRSYRFIAWLLTLVMILNMSPLSAFAESADEVNSMKSNKEKSPPLESESGYSVIDNLSTGEAPGDNLSFYVQYVIRGDYTPSGNSLLWKNAAGESRFAVQDKQVSAYQEGLPTGFEWDSPKSSWQAAHDNEPNLLTMYIKPLASPITVHYYLVLIKDGVTTALAMQAYQNKEVLMTRGPLDEVELLEAKD